jgi:hypothetical protein
VSKKIYEIVDKLPTGGLTVRALKTLDTVVPGQWNNLVGFDNTIKTVTGETDEAMVQAIGERAIALFNDKKQGYQSALWLYETVDSASGLLGAAALANRIGQDTFLGFLKNLSPKPEKAQTIDLVVKLVTEVVAFCKISGIPGDSWATFSPPWATTAASRWCAWPPWSASTASFPLGPTFLPRRSTLSRAWGRAISTATRPLKASRPKFPVTTTEPNSRL